MGTTQTTLQPPFLSGSKLSVQEQLYLQTIQNHAPLVECDTSAGDLTIALPPAGVNAATAQTTGQTAQNQELTYIKTTADANTVTITGGEFGPIVLTTQAQSVKFKSSGTVWYAVARWP
jgi:hypothetical protein